MRGRGIRLHRGDSPCLRCTKEMKALGCHDSCMDYLYDYRGEIDRVNEARAAYNRKPPVRF